jgi:hypothetical protein
VRVARQLQIDTRWGGLLDLDGLVYQEHDWGGVVPAVEGGVQVSAVSGDAGRGRGAVVHPGEVEGCRAAAQGHPLVAEDLHSQGGQVA